MPGVDDKILKMNVVRIALIASIVYCLCRKLGLKISCLGPNIELHD